MLEMMAAGNATYTELKNLCVWAKTAAGMGSFYRSRHELVFVWKSGTGPHILQLSARAETGARFPTTLIAPTYFRRTASYVDRVLRGEKPGDLPFQQPTKYQLTIKPQERQGAWPDDSAVAARTVDEVIE